MIVPLLNHPVWGVCVHCQTCEEPLGYFKNCLQAKEVLTKLGQAVVLKTPTPHGATGPITRTLYYCPEHINLLCKRRKKSVDS